MAFCPECGKAVTPDAAVCVSCGKQLRAEDKNIRAARFQGTMMMTAPDVKAQVPANVNGAAPVQQANVVAAAAGMTSPRLGPPVTAVRSSRPPSTKQSSHQMPNFAAPALGRSKGLKAHATMMGPGVSPEEIAQAKSAQKGQRKNATMVGAALSPTTPRSKPPAAASKPRSEPAPAKQAVESGRLPVARPTTPQNSSSASVRAVQSVPVSPSPDGAVRAKPAAVRAPTPAEHAHAEAQTVATPRARATPERKSPDPARVVHAIPEVVATVIDPAEQHNARTVPREYLPGDPMAPQPSTAARANRPRPFAPDQPEEEQGNYILLYWAVCVAVVAAAAALAFRLF